MKGCTAAYDLTAEFPQPTAEGLAAIGQAYADVGMRAVVAPMVADITLLRGDPRPDGRACRRRCRRTSSACAWRPTRRASRRCARRCTAGARPRAASASPWRRPSRTIAADEFMLACLKLARDFGVGLHSHVAESKVQVIVGLPALRQDAHRASAIRWACVGPDFTVAHGVWLDGDDMKRLGDHGASVAHNPGSNMLLGNGMADMRGMLDAKVNVGIGTDGASCSDNQNMYENMRLASMVSKVQGPDTGSAGSRPRRCCEAATAGSARALGLRRQDRPDREGLQGRHRLPRPRPRELDPVQRSDQPDRAYRGRQRASIR